MPRGAVFVHVAHVRLLGVLTFVVFLQVKLVQHTYSCLFGSFLCNSGKEREDRHVQERTCSVWSLLRPANRTLRNMLYSSHSETVSPMCLMLFLPFGATVSCYTFTAKIDESTTKQEKGFLQTLQTRQRSRLGFLFVFGGCHQMSEQPPC